MRTIRGRLLATLLIGLAVVLTASGAGVYGIARAGLLRQLDAGLRTRAMSLASLTTLDDGRLEFEFDEGRSESVDDGWFEFRTGTGVILRRSDNLDEMALPRHPGGDEPIVFGDVELPGGGRGRCAWVTFHPRVDHEEDGETALPSLQVAAVVDRGPVDRALATLLGALAVVGGIVGVTAVLLVSLGVRWALMPLARLSRQVEGVGESTISRRFDETDAPGELLPFYRQLNAMLDRVERTLDRERSFADAAAHELRTPLAELRTTAEVAIRWPDRERAVTALQEALTIGREMEHLVESLLLISRGRTAGADEAADEAPVAPIVQRCLDRVAGPIGEKRLTLTVDLDEHGTLRAPRDAVEIIIRNLVDNAVHYTPSDGHITIRGSENGSTTNGNRLLIVENDPVDLDDTDVARLFEPFWRAEGSRSDRLHAGLGLAVVGHIAHAIGLRVDAGLTGTRLQMRVSPAS